MHDLLVGTRDVILARGHAKNALEDALGGVCLYGGLSAVLCGSASAEFTHGEWGRYACAFGYSDWRSLVDAFAHELGFVRFENAARWNDDPHTTMDDVIARLNTGIAATTPKLSEVVAERELAAA